MSAESGPPRFAFVALVGWTNVGKSTLLNRLIGADIAAVSPVAQTTRRRILGVRTDTDRGQLAFLDTPGFHKPHHRMNRVMLETARSALREVDVVLHLIDAARDPGPGDRQVADLLRGAPVTRIVVLNKVDTVAGKARLLPRIERIAAEWDVTEIHPVSARTGDGCDALVDAVFRLAPAGEPRFDADYLTDQSERSLVEEWIREGLIGELREEVPHGLAVTIESWANRDDGLAEIHAAIWVDRESHKAIVIGRGGERLKAVGTRVRERLRDELDRRTHLELWVKVRERWRDDPSRLRELGLDGG